MSLIESILSETRERNVISEQHDPSAINFVNGLSDPGEMIRCGYLAGIRRHEGEADDAYAERIRPVVMALPQQERDKIMGAALRRADLDTSTRKVAVMVAGQPPWHRLGVNVAAAVSSQEASVLASLNWTVSKRPLHFQHADSWKEQAEAFAICRDDTGDCLGIVGSRYEPIQNDQGFAFLDDVLSSFGAKYETAGAIYGGRKVWMLANLPDCFFQVGMGDEVTAYAIFTNPHDGSGMAYCYPTTERVVCGNTFRVSTKDRGKGIGIRHTGSVQSKINAAKDALGRSVEGFSDFADHAAALARVRVPSVNAYVDSVLDGVLDLKASDVTKGAEGLARQRCRPDVSPDDLEHAVKTAEREIRSRGEIWDDIIGRFNSERCRVNGIDGSLWAAMNAVTESADYSKGKRQTGTPESQQSRRFESILAGDRDEMKQVSYQEALKLLSA